MVITRHVIPPRPLPNRTHVLRLVDLVEVASPPTSPATVSFHPRLLALSLIQVHVLKCVAAHCWTHQGGIPYHPPTAHQAAVARGLAGEMWRLLLRMPERKPTYVLTPLGDAVAHRVLHVVPAAQDRAREREFDRMRALMRHDLRSLTVLGVDDDDDTAQTSLTDFLLLPLLPSHSIETLSHRPKRLAWVCFCWPRLRHVGRERLKGDPMVAALSRTQRLVARRRSWRHRVGIAASLSRRTSAL